MKRIIFFLLCNKVDTQRKKYVTIFQSNLDKLEKMEAAGQGCAQDFLRVGGGGGGRKCTGTYHTERTNTTHSRNILTL